MSDRRTQIVGAGYDAMVDTWESWKAQITNDPRDEWCRELLTRLAPEARVVELGSGGGTPETVRLAERFRLTGVDLSAEQVRRARERVPEAEFVHADFTKVEFEPESIDAVAAFYSFNHVPRVLLPGLFARIRGWLAPNGFLLTALGARDSPDWVGEWLGATMFFSGWDPETNRRLLAEAGFALLRDEVVTLTEPEGDGPFHWVLAQR